MSLASVLVLAAGGMLAYVNGANDVSKGVATLVGSGIAGYRRAIAWGAAWTAAGGLLGALFAGAMLATFGSDLLSPGAAPTFATAIATLVGAGGWVLLATRAGLPVSTTHAIVGALAGVVPVAHGVGALEWGALGGKVLLPLLLSPLAAHLLTSALVRAMLTAGASETCGRAHPRAVRLTVDRLHWLTSAATSLARGMNDAPKMVALVLAAYTLAGGDTPPTPALFALVTAAMVAGSAAAGRRVSHVLAERVTAMDPHGGFAASLVTSSLVAAGAVLGLPMSTTHVSSAGIMTAGGQRGTLDRRTGRDILLAWLVTLPGAAALGAAAYAVATAASA